MSSRKTVPAPRPQPTSPACACVTYRPAVQPVSIEAALIIRNVFVRRGVTAMPDCTLAAELAAWFDSLDVRQGNKIDALRNRDTADIWLERNLHAPSTPFRIVPATQNLAS